MNHSYLDQYSDRDSLIHRLDPRTKLITCFLFIGALVLLPADSWLAYGICALLLAVSLFLSRLPLGYVLKRSLVIIPFVLMVTIFIPFFKEGEIAGSYSIGGLELTVTADGLAVFRNIMAKAWLSVLNLIILTATTPMPSLLKALEKLRMPRVMVMLLSFMYRYIFVLTDEVMRLKRARDSRNFGGSNWWQIKTVGRMISTLFLRSYERGERVYAAMLARGYDGHSRTAESSLSYRQRDAYYGVGAGLVIISAGLLGFII